MADYGSITYWNERYTKNNDYYDWYQKWEKLKTVLTRFLNEDDEILIVGCGVSKLSEDMYLDGFKKQLNIDFSEVAIRKMSEMNKDRETMKFAVMNVIDLKDIQSSTFTTVIDKGTLDTILCGEKSTENAKKMMGEIVRILKDDGIFICITYGNPSFRLPYLEMSEYNWSIQTFTVEIPYSLPNDNNKTYHYIFVCKKNYTLDLGKS